MNAKTCTKCAVEKPMSEFYAFKPRPANPNGGYFGECKECNRKRARLAMQSRRDADPGYGMRMHYKTRYGITPERYAELLDAQGGKCAICGTDSAGGRGTAFHVDHDHGTGEVRGLLCHGCNTGIGNLGENVDRLMAAAAYLLSHRDVLADLGVF